MTECHDLEGRQLKYILQDIAVPGGKASIGAIGTGILVRHSFVPFELTTIIGEHSGPRNVLLIVIIVIVDVITTKLKGFWQVWLVQHKSILVSPRLLDLIAVGLTPQLLVNSTVVSSWYGS